MPYLYESDLIASGLSEAVRYLDDKRWSVGDFSTELLYRVGGRFVEEYTDGMKLPMGVHVGTLFDGKKHNKAKGFLGGKEHYIAVFAVSFLDHMLRKDQSASKSAMRGATSALTSYVSDSFLKLNKMKDVAIA